MPISQIPGNMLGISQIGQSSSNLGVPIVENSPTISANYSISTGSNAISGGPITVADGVVLTIPDGSVWTVI
jgi:hypothetical protein